MEQTQLWPDQTPDLWSTSAEAFAAASKRFTRLYAEDTLQRVAIQPGERLLDVAAGTGAVAFAAAERGADVVATDFAPGMVEQMSARIQSEGMSNVRAEVMDGQNLDLRDDSFDVAVSQFGLIFFPDRAKGFREMYRVLKSGGRAAVLGWSVLERVQQMAPFFQAMQMLDVGPPPRPGPPPALSLSDPDTFRREMEAAGFQQVTISPMTHQYTVDSPQAAWDELRSLIPTIQALPKAIGAEKAEEAGRNYVRILKERYGDGPLALDCEALVGIAVK